MNAKQERFALNIVSGMSSSQAAKDAWGYTNDNSASSKGRQMTHHPAIAARIADLRAKLDEKLISAMVMDIEARKVRLSELAQKGRANPVDAIRELNRMEGVYEEGTRVTFNNVRFVIGRGYQEPGAAPENGSQAPPGRE